MPILFACQRILQAPVGSRRILAVGSLFEIMYIPAESLGPAPEPEAPAEAKASPIRTSHAPTGTYTYIHEQVAPDGSFQYLQQGMTIPGPGERFYSGLLAGQCGCCYYRRREILEYTNEPGFLALMTPGWYQDHDGSWKWWHGEAVHGTPGCSCRNHRPQENLDAQQQNQDPGNQENLEAQQHFIEDPDFMDFLMAEPEYLENLDPSPEPGPQ